MPNKFEKLAEDAHHLSDEQFKIRFSSLTRFSDDDVSKIMKDTGISKEDLISLLLEVRKPGEINNKTAQSILTINGGIETLVAIIKEIAVVEIFSLFFC